jgi:hypothetical protein
MLYAPPNSSATAVTGRNVAQAKRNAVERALLAGDIVRGRVRFADWTIGQAATILKVCPAYVAAAIAIGDDIAARRDVLLGCRPLITPPAKPVTETLAARLARATASRAGCSRARDWSRRGLELHGYPIAVVN